MSIRGGSIINIAGTTPVDDPEYRYKMPAVFGKIEGRGNGIKTVIPNIADVGLSLHRDPAEVNKFFGCELGAQTTYSVEADRAIVNGAHTDATLQSLIHRYIESFVLCPNCRLPETDYKIKNEVIYHRCAACGAKEMLDMNHKLTTFILAQDKKAKKEGKAKDKKKKDKKKDDGKSNCFSRQSWRGASETCKLICPVSCDSSQILTRRRRRRKRRKRKTRRRKKTKAASTTMTTTTKKTKAKIILRMQSLVTKRMISPMTLMTTRSTPKPALTTRAL
jgi:translation initiation factor 5